MELEIQIRGGTSLPTWSLFFGNTWGSEAWRFFHTCSLLNSKICHSEIFSVLVSSNLEWPMCYQAQVDPCCCYLISVQLALVKVHAAALPSAKISTLNLFGKGVEKTRVEGRNWERCVVVSAWRNKVQETMYSLVLALWKTRLVNVTDGSGMSQIFLVSFSFDRFNGI